ncbi:MAG: extracellular solute-binding protein, partial [Clostridia bacterium]|nr:extracellular solute-binding protein [Clostridia bacterium]
MKKSFVKILTLCLAVVLIVSCFAGCKKETVTTETITCAASEAGWKGFEEVGQELLDYAASFTDLNIEWVGTTGEALKLQLNSGANFPDVIFGNKLSAVEVVRYANSGILIPLEEYITKKNTPNLWKLFEKYPTAKSIITLSDGHIYSLPSISDFEAGAYESSFFINKAWLDKLGLEVPETLDDLYEVLKAFKTQDPNGNGKADEIPMSWYNNAGYSYPEVLLSSWGVSAKHGTWDQFLAIQDGKVKFAPVMNEWKEMVSYYGKLYKEGLLDMECMTQNQASFNAKVANQVSKVGFYWNDANISANPEEYIAIKPLSADGKIKPVLHLHPLGITYANTNMFEITSTCEDPAAVMRWIDNFYSFEVATQLKNGMLGRTFYEEDGMWKFNKPEEGMSQAVMINNNTLISWPCAELTEWFDEKVETTEVQKSYIDTYKLYEEYIDDE